MNHAKIEKLLKKLDDPYFLLNSHEVAALFRVDTKTASRWATAGRMPNEGLVRTPGGHWRFRAPMIRDLLASDTDFTKW